MVHLPFVGTTTKNVRPTRNSIKSLIASRSIKSLIAKPKKQGMHVVADDNNDYNLSDDDFEDYENDYDENIGLHVAALRKACGVRYGDDSLADRQWSEVFGWVRSQQGSTLRIQAAFRGELTRRRLLKLKQEHEDASTEVDDSSDDHGSLAQPAKLPTPSAYFAGQGSLCVSSTSEQLWVGDQEQEPTTDMLAAKECFASQRRFIHLHELRSQAEDRDDSHLGEESFV